jgi:hypothetical protein
MKNEIQKSENTNSEITVYSKPEFVKKFEPVSMVMEYRHINSIEKAIKEDSNGVSFYVKTFGFDTVQAVIELHLLALNESVNVGRPLTEFQIKEISIEIITVYYFLSVIEISLVLRKAKRGDYGKLYNALNIVDILSWFSSYAEERTNHFINESTKDIQTDFTLRSEDRRVLKRHNKLNGNNQD